MGYSAQYPADPRFMQPQAQYQVPPSNKRKWILGGIAVLILIVVAIILITLFAAGDDAGSGTDNGTGAGTGSGNGNGDNGNGGVIENPYGQRTGVDPEDPLAGTDDGSSSVSACPHPGMTMDDSGTCVCGGNFIMDPNDPSQCICKSGYSLDPGDASRCVQTGGGRGSGAIAPAGMQCPPYYVLNEDETECVPVGLTGGTTPQSQLPTIYGYGGFAYNGPKHDTVHLGTGVGNPPSLLGCMTLLHNAHKQSGYGPDWNIANYGTYSGGLVQGCQMYKAPNYVDMAASCDQGSCVAQSQDMEYMITTEPERDGAGQYITPLWVIYPDGTTARSPDLNAEA